MVGLNNITNLAKNVYNSAQDTLQPLREGKGTLNGTIVTHIGAQALGVTSLLYACDKISAKVPLALAAVQLGSWFVYGNKMYTRYLPRMNEMGFANMLKGTPAYWQFYDKGLCEDGIARWCSDIGAKSVLDVCCGEEGLYVKALNTMGIGTKGIDLNLSPRLQDSYDAVVGNVLEEFPQEIDRKYDLVLSIEAGAKLPPGSEEIYIANLTKHAEKAILCSWPVPGQEGPHQRNKLTNDQVEHIFNQYGWVRDAERETLLKAAADPIDFWFQDTIMAFVPA